MLHFPSYKKGVSILKKKFKLSEALLLGALFVVTGVVPVFAMNLSSSTTKADAESEITNVAKLKQVSNSFTAPMNKPLTLEKNEPVMIPATNSKPVPVVEEEIIEVQTPTISQVLSMEATAYSWLEPGSETGTATGVDLTTNPRVIAVDPKVIPLGSRVHVEGYGDAIAADTGGLIKGNIIDVHVGDLTEMTNWGRRQVTVTVYA